MNRSTRFGDKLEVDLTECFPGFESFETVLARMPAIRVYYIQQRHGSDFFFCIAHGIAPGSIGY